MASIITINGVPIGRCGSDGLVLDQFSISMDSPDTMEFSQIATHLPSRFRQGHQVTLTVDNLLVFVGQIVSLHPSGIGRGPISIGYRCLGLNWLANQIWITAADGAGQILFNLPETDPNYVASMSGLSVGEILQYLYNLHASQLSDVGIGANGVALFNGADLASLTIVPPDPVICTGRFWNNVNELMMNWYNSYGSWIVPSGTTLTSGGYWTGVGGTIRHENLLALPNGTSTPVTFTLDALTNHGNVVTLDSISEDFSECYTRTIIRGAGNIQGANLSLTYGGRVSIGNGTLIYGWSPAQQAAWNYGAYINPPGASESGLINSMISTQLTVQIVVPSTAPTYGANFWSGLNGEVWAFFITGGSSIFNEQRRITANTAPVLSGGNYTYTITVDVPFNNSGYDHYQIRGRTSFTGVTTLADVWRKFFIIPPAVAQALEQQFSHSVPWSGGIQDAVVMTTSPMGEVEFSNSGNAISWPMAIQVVPWGTGVFSVQATGTCTVSSGHVASVSLVTGGSGYPPLQTTIPITFMGGGGAGATGHATSSSTGVITAVSLVTGGFGYTSMPTVEIGVQTGYVEFYQPICAAYCSQAQLNAGGASIPDPVDVNVLVPYSVGPMTAIAPSTGYQGTAYTVNGLQRTLYLDYPEWIDYASSSNYLLLAQQRLYTVMNTVIEGTLTCYGKESTFFTLGQAINIAGATYTTGYEAIAAPVRAVVLDYAPTGGAIPWITRINFSTRMKPFAGDRLYVHPMTMQSHFMGSELGRTPMMSDLAAHDMGIFDGTSNIFGQIMASDNGAMISDGAMKVRESETEQFQQPERQRSRQEEIQHERRLIREAQRGPQPNIMAEQERRRDERERSQEVARQTALIERQSSPEYPFEEINRIASDVPASEPSLPSEQKIASIPDNPFAP